MSVIKYSKLLIMESEGFSPTIYKCPAGKNTIGFGRNLEVFPLTEEEKANDCYLNGMYGIAVTRETAIIWLEKAIIELYNTLLKYDWFKLQSEVRQAVVIDMSYNLGITGFFKFKKLIKALDNQDYTEAVAQMIDSKWYHQVGLRSKRNVKIMETDTFFNYTDLDISRRA